MEMRKFYQTATAYLFIKLPLAKKGPERPHPLLHKAVHGIQAIVRIVKMIDVTGHQ